MPSLNVDTSTDGDTLVAAPGVGRFVRVLGYSLQPASSVVCTLKSNAAVIATNQGAGPWVLTVGGDTTLDCVPNDPLKIGLGSGVRVTGVIEYAVYGCPPGNFS